MEILNNYHEEGNLVSLVTSKKVWYSRTPNPMYNVAVIDLGTKLNFIKRLNQKGCNVIVFPYNVTKEEILKYKPNGLFISNGPGDPAKLDEVVKTIKSFIGQLPIFGVGLGCQLIAKCYDVDSYKLTCGYHGCNYPVKNLINGRVEITTQNILYSLNKEQLENSKLTITHENVIGKEVVGVKDEESKVIAIQYEPAKPIDKDGEDMSLEFLNLIKNSGGKKNA
jgi:carbamoyl-phosphate synthase small subunit